ncbi:MAG: ribonuclease Z [Flavobacteriales bacterium]|nr:ribonuclease Z [Flavobacteriales bacterium]
MALKVLILGSGSALPTISTNQTSQVIECGNQLYLVDCGEGTQIQLRKNKVKIQNINHIFISHLHGDHFFGLVGLLSTMHLLGRKNELNIYAPKGLDEIVKIQFRNAGSYLSFEMHFHTIEQSGEILLEDSKLTVKSLPLKHRIPCYGFLFEEKEGLRKIKISALAEYKIPTYARKSITEGKDFERPEGEVIPNRLLTNDPPKPTKYAFCSDTAYYEKLIPLLKDVDLLYHEATFIESERKRAIKTFHPTAADAANIAKKSEVKKLLLGHFSNRYKHKDGFLQEARPIFKETDVAVEGKEYLV